ncbi:hypothetical protein GIB67_007727 [Kingdonia uniflora]|uniref:Uncharacterized protein n=1 Tax=Kingdonia uniflora TaxID=39325 RepID=A0A7J7N1S5_9MAGN|nr:hypothetical protein GIB67_007727 [Kingdonia uniflora]
MKASVLPLQSEKAPIMVAKTSIATRLNDPSDYSSDAIAIGAFHAIQKDILTSNSAGNYGPRQATLTNAAPWILTVEASSIDRRFIGKVVLGNGETIEGNAINGFGMRAQKLPLICAEDASACEISQMVKICDVSCLNLNETLAEGKIIFCEELIIGIDSEISKAAGKIFADDVDFNFVYPFPASCLSVRNGERVKSYINNTKYNGPGVDILAARSPIAPPSDVRRDTRYAKYSIVSGTSMSCAHALPRWRLRLWFWPYRPYKGNESRFSL